MYAVIETGGKQVKCELGETIYVEHLDIEEGKVFTFEKVLAVKDQELVLGAPYIEGAKVKATCEKQGRGKKIVVYKYEPKKQYRNTQGHRQAYTKLTIKSIEVNGVVKKAPTKKALKEAEKEVEAQPLKDQKESA